MTEPKTPEDFGIKWNYDSPIVPTIRTMVLTMSIPWIQVITELSFCLACMLAGCEDGDERLRISENLATGLLFVGETGDMPEEYRPSGGPLSPDGAVH